MRSSAGSSRPPPAAAAMPLPQSGARCLPCRIHRPPASCRPTRFVPAGPLAYQPTMSKMPPLHGSPRQPFSARLNLTAATTLRLLDRIGLVRFLKIGVRTHFPCR